MSDSGADVFLLAAGGYVDALIIAHHLDVAPNSAHVTSKDLGEIFLAEESVLITGFFCEARESDSSGGFGAVLIADLKVFRIE